MNHNYRFKDDVLHGTRHPKHDMYNKMIITIKKDSLPDKIDLSDKILSIYDQGDIGACVSNALASAIKMKLKVISSKRSIFSFIKDNIDPARLYNYNLARLLEGVILTDDSGCMVETALEVLNRYSFPDESVFGYNKSTFSVFPDLVASVEANKNTSYKFTFNKLNQELGTIKASLVEGNPVLMGIVLFDSLSRTVNGLIPTPNPQTEKVIGGHCILVIGYDDSKQTFKFVNCWSANWGNNGFGYIMYDYAMNANIAGDIYNLV